MQTLNSFYETLSEYSVVVREYLRGFKGVRLTITPVVADYYSVIEVKVEGCELYLCVDRTPHLCWSFNGRNKLGTIEAGLIDEKTPIDTVLKNFMRLIHRERASENVSKIEPWKMSLTKV